MYLKAIGVLIALSCTAEILCVLNLRRLSNVFEGGT